MQDTFNASNPLAWQIRWTVIDGLQFSGPVSLVTPAGLGSDAAANSAGMTFNQNGGFGYVFTGNAFSPFSGTPPAPDTILPSGSATPVAAGEGNDTAVAQSGNDQIATGVGNNVVFLQTGNNLVAREGNDTVVGGAGDDTVSVSANVLAFGGSGAMRFLNGGGSSLLIGGTGTLGVSGGLGSVTVFGGSGGDNHLVAGNPPSEPAGAGNETLSGFNGTGNNVYFDGTGSAAVVMGSGSEEYLGGSGNDVVVAGLGNDTMFAGTGADVFSFNNQPRTSNDLIAGFKVGTDVVQLQDFAAGAATQVFQTASVSGGNTVLSLPDGTSVTLIGVTNLSGSSIV